MSWDPLQREVLAALGHTVYRAVTPSLQVPDDPLLHAVLRAAGRGVDAADAGLLCSRWPPPALLRDAAAKRALWPQVRALRRARPS